MATYQRGDITLRSAVTTNDTLLDGTTAGATFAESDRPSHAKEIDNDTDYLEVYVTGTAAANKTFTLTLWGYGVTGPARRMASVAGVLGAAVTGTSQFYADTLTVTDKNLVAVTEKDTATDHVCKLVVPCLGYKYIAAQVTDLGGAGGAASITVMARPYGSR